MLPGWLVAQSTMRMRESASFIRSLIDDGWLGCVRHARREASFAGRMRDDCSLCAAGAQRKSGEPDMHPMLTIAVKAARRAGSIINRGARDLDRLAVTAKGPKDFVSEIDRAAEAAIVDTLHATYPDHAILAEEGTAKGANADIRASCGSSIRSTARPISCTAFRSTAFRSRLQHKGQITQGVIYDPVRNDLFTATRGRGAFLNDHRLRVSRRQHLKDCLIGTGFPFRDGSDLETYIAMMRAMMQQTAGLRRPGRGRAGPGLCRRRAITTDSGRSGSTPGTWPPAAC